MLVAGFHHHRGTFARWDGNAGPKASPLEAAGSYQALIGDHEEWPTSTATRTSDARGIAGSLPATVLTGIRHLRSSSQSEVPASSLTDTEPGGQDAVTMLLGRTDLRVPRLGIGAMVWGDMSTAPWWSPARQAYGPTCTVQERGRRWRRAWPPG